MNTTLRLLLLLIVVVCSKTISDIQDREPHVSINMKLSKSNYKEYEPVIAKFVLVNNDSKTYNIYTMFSLYCRETIIDITDNYGHHWFQNNSPFDYTIIGNPRYTLKSGDTLIVSMPINNWGDLLRGNGLFAQLGYFPAGRKYKAALIFNELKSNQVEFEVDSLNEEDKKVIQLDNDIYGKITLDSAAIKSEILYPDNIFTEYLSAEGLGTRYWKDLRKDKNNPPIEPLIKDYEIFFTKYPDSYYIYDDNFMWPYYFNIFYNKRNFKKILAEQIKNNKSNALKEVLSYNNAESRIKQILEIYVRDLYE